MTRAQALRRYLEITGDWPELVEARYRASVVAATLATTLTQMTAEEATGVLAYLGDVPIGATPAIAGPRIQPRAAQLRVRAAHESKAVLQLLKPWYALLHEFRLRNQYEPKAYARRRLRHTVSISKHSVRMRRIRGDKRLRRRIEVRYRSAAVHFIHMKLGWGTIDWQAHYNASCYDALLLAHLQEPWPPK